MVDVRGAAKSLGKLCLMKFFPSDPNAQTALLESVCAMASSNEQIEWLVAKMLRTYNEWPGPMEMRACFCSKFKPADKYELHSDVYPDGIPGDREQLRQLPPAALPALPPGHEASADPKLEQAVGAAAVAMKMPPARRISSRFSRMLEELITGHVDRTPIPGATAQVITKEDIDKAVEEMHRLRELEQEENLIRRLGEERFGF